jgi:hypothetical protein
MSVYVCSPSIFDPLDTITVMQPRRRKVEIEHADIFIPPSSKIMNDKIIFYQDWLFLYFEVQYFFLYLSFVDCYDCRIKLNIRTGNTIQRLQ